jgi:hypothetical protein
VAAEEVLTSAAGDLTLAEGGDEALEATTIGTLRVAGAEDSTAAEAEDSTAVDEEALTAADKMETCMIMGWMKGMI